MTEGNGWVRTERGTLVKRYAPPPTEPKRGAFPCPRVMTDTMELTEHIDGKFYDSKSKFREVTKAHGCIEVGNDPARHRPVQKATADPVKRREAVQKVIAQAGL